jgi:hypothetical protein
MRQFSNEELLKLHGLFMAARRKTKTRNERLLLDALIAAIVGDSLRRQPAATPRYWRIYP